MPGYEPQLTQYLGRANVLIRLTREDSISLADKLRDALARNTGVSFVLMGMNGAFSVTTSMEQGKQFKAIAFNKAGSTVESPMKGYNGPWSHIELAFPYNSIKDIQGFLDRAGKGQTTLS